MPSFSRAVHAALAATADTLRGSDSPARRGDQLLAALDHLQYTDAADQVDPDRLAVMGHSMGGGMTPWSPDRTFPEVAAPTLVVGAEDDDERYTQLLCPQPAVDAELSEVRSTCD